jgi:hypothetical protein
MWIFCGGMMRSGSTLQYQITAQLVEEAQLGRRLEWIEPQDFIHVREQLKDEKTWKVFKAHHCTDSMVEEFNRGNAVGIYIYRDIRDAFTSQMTKASVKPQLLLNRGFIASCLESYEKWTHLPQVLISQYENVVDDIAGEVARIAQHLGISLDASKIHQIADNLSLANQKSRLQRVQSFKQIGRHSVDSHSLLHSNHIHSGKVGRWQEELTFRDIKKIEDQAGLWLAEQGYALSAPSLD